MADNPAIPPISFVPILVLLIGVVVVAIIVAMWYLSRTKAVTTEARVGQFEIIVLPSGDRIVGLTSLARGLVKQEFTQVLAQAQRVTDQQAKDLNAAFEDLFFYGIKGRGRGKYLIVSSVNIESPQYSIDLEQVFELPFGYITRRLVVADGVQTERAGWTVYTIDPRGITVEILGQKYENMTNIGEAAAAVKEAAIRLQKEMPWREVALAREKQLHEAHSQVAEISHELSDTKLGLAKKPLLETEHPPEVQPTGKGLSWDRIVVPIVFGVAVQMFLPMVRPEILEPLPYSIGSAVVMFFLYPWIRRKLSKWI